MIKSKIKAVFKAKSQYREDMLELWPIARAIISPSSFQNIKKKLTLLRKTLNKMKQTKKKSSTIPSLFK